MRPGLLDRTQIVAAVCVNALVALMLTAVLWQVPSVTYAAPIRAVAQKQKFIPTVGTPSMLRISSVGIQLAVVEGDYQAKTNSWTLSDNDAMHATSTVPLNDSNGTTLLYGHGTAAVFANLVMLKKGDIANVQARSGDTYIYRYVQKRDVLPDDTSVFQVTGKPKLVLQTCSGPWDSQRSLYTFEFVKVNHERVS